MTNIMDVGDIVYEYLEKNGYHGLWNPDGECACVLKDLGACDEMNQNCQAGYMAPCDCGDHDFHIVTERPGTIIPPSPIERASNELDDIGKQIADIKQTMSQIAELLGSRHGTTGGTSST